MILANCPTCGSAVPGKFCPQCGTALPEANAAPPAPPAPAASIPPTYQAPAASQPAPAPPAYQPGAFPPPSGYPQQTGYGQPGQAMPTYNTPPVFAPAPQKRSRKGLIWAGVLIFLAAVIGLGLFLVDEYGSTLTGSSSEADKVTGKASPMVIATEVEPESMEPLNEVSTIPTDAPVVYATAQIWAKSGQVVSTGWHLDGKYLDSIKLTLDRDVNGDWVAFNINNTTGELPKGKWRVIMYVDGYDVGTVGEFEVK